MKRFVVLVLITVLASGIISAAALKAYNPFLAGGILADFEGFAEGTHIAAQIAGVTFSQPGGTPIIDNSPALFGYGFLSGTGVLTGSSDGGALATTAGITITFNVLQSKFQVFFTDTSPLGNYSVQAFDSSSTLLESITLLSSEILPPGYSGGNFPAPGTTPLPGLFAGFVRPSADIKSIQIGPSTGNGDSFAIDDARWGSAAVVVPEPATTLLMSAGLLAFAAAWRKRRA